MSADHFWLTVKSIAAAIDGNAATSEEALDQIERNLMQLTKAERGKIRHSMTVIVAQLARIEVRMMDTDGPAIAIV
jgi:hypothetical protein